jgi:curved DNA-binding protein CbpA
MSDPYLALGITSDADDALVHAAYLAAIKACPPERDLQRFQTVRAAYELIRTRKDRLRYELFDTSLPAVTELLERAAPLQQPADRPGQELFAALLRSES